MQHFSRDTLQDFDHGQHKDHRLHSAVSGEDPNAFTWNQFSALSNETITTTVNDKVWDYDKGGFHPVHLDELYDNGRYRIVHKLGAGGWATVWLAWDMKEDRWAALKFLAAEESTEELRSRRQWLRNAVSTCGDNAAFVVDYRDFMHCGPNGTHLCQVSSVLGPPVERLSDGINSRLTPSMSRWISYEIVRGLDDLHAQDVCHGGESLIYFGLYQIYYLLTSPDVTTGNILFTSSIDSHDEKEINRLFGPPKSVVLELEVESENLEAPRYIVEPLDFLSSQENLIGTGVKIVDFDLSFPSKSPPKGILGTPPRFMAPEVAAGFPASPASDVWALGCCIFRIRTGYFLFPDPKIKSPADLLRSVAQVLPGSEFPRSWSNILFDEYGDPTEDRKRGKTLCMPERDRPLESLVKGIWDQPLPENSAIITGRKPQAPAQHFPSGSKPYPQPDLNIFWKPRLTKINDSCPLDNQDALLERMPRISDDEAYWLHDLLSKILTYEPSKRITTREILDHPWFQIDG